MKFSLASVALVASSPLALTVALASVACSSSNNSSSDSSDDAGNGADTSVGNQDSGNGNDSASPTLTFSADIYAPIIEHHCVGCHGFAADGGAGSGIAFGKLDLSSVDAGYANLVNVAAAGAACGSEDGGSALVRVVPGNAADSLLYLKVDGFTTAPPCGSPMPKSGEIPDGGQAVVAQQIQTWIDQGAQP
jgi:mono/diheme cytochrome c family protein